MLHADSKEVMRCLPCSDQSMQQGMSPKEASISEYQHPSTCLKCIMHHANTLLMLRVIHNTGT